MLTLLQQFPIEFVRVFGQLAPWLLFGAVIAAIMHQLLPESLVRRQLTGYSGVIKAVGLGVPLPLCSCGVIPAGIGLKQDGASNGSVIGFLISTPQTGVDSIMVTASFLGLPFAIFKVVSASITGLVGGFLAEALSDSTTDDTSLIDIPDTERSFSLSGIVEYALMVLQSIWRWLIVGVVASAIIGILVPPNALNDTMFANDIVASLAVLAISVPLYVCATSSVPIAAALVTAGMPVGSALVFLMAGPATNVATIGAVYKTLGGRQLMIYLSTIVFFSVGFGFAFESLFPNLGSTVGHHHDAATPISIASSVVLAVLMVKFFVDDVQAARTAKRMAATQDAVLVIGVEGMTCGGCSTGLQKKLSESAMVQTAHVDLANKSATVTGPITQEQLAELVTKAGYTPTELAS